MPDLLSLRLLGQPQVSRGAGPVTGFISAKAQALLFYLAVTGRPHSREALAGLLWGDMAEAAAAKNLRNALSNLRGLAGDHLLITREAAAFDRASAYWLDVEAFRAALSTAPVAAGAAAPDGPGPQPDLSTLHRAVELYQGDFLEGFYVGGALPLEEWLLGQRALLKRMMLQALHTLVVRHLEREEHAAGIDYANRLLALEPWREEVHRTLMVLLARSRQRSAALAQYDTCCRVLQAELGVAPMPETTALYERLRAAAAPPPHNLPPQAAAFVGRQAELAEIARFLRQPERQLLTLVGPGGIGKTRLALQAAARCVEPEASFDLAFPDGVFFVPLGDESEAATGLIVALAEALRLASGPAGASARGPLTPQAQLLSELRHRRMLLILDGFDHRVGEARQVADLLRLAPGLKLLVTSRVRLNLQEEWLLEVEGLAYPGRAGVEPGTEAPADLSAYSAVALFTQQARRVQAGFELAPADQPAVLRICRLVQGVPLCLELAAAWLRMLTCAEIADEIAHGLDFLTSGLQNVPERHRSLRAVFDHSWNLLTPPEQAAFGQLAVFRGGFAREAAAQVVGVSLPVLAGLVDKSLLRRSAAGRYEMHDLLRQYAEEKLQAAGQFEAAHDRHCRYYAGLMAQHQAQLKSDEPQAALAALSAERDNVRAAWNWAVSRRRVTELNQMMDCL